MILIVASTRDIAGMNIARNLKEHYDFEKLAETRYGNPVFLLEGQEETVKLLFVEVEITETQCLTELATVSLLICISKHRSRSGIPTLSVHTPGNLSDAELGGLPRKVSVAPARAMKSALLEMARVKDTMNLNYEVSYECTHHGPSLNIPTMFAELGSSPKQWKDRRAAEAVAHAAIAATRIPVQYTAALGIGGPHYNTKFTRVALTTPIAFGHIIPKYIIPKIDGRMLEQCLAKTQETVKLAILDWKGIKGADKARLTKELEKLGTSIEKV